MQKGNYVSVFSVKKGSGNYYDVQLSCSRKDKQTGNYVPDFSGFVRFVGTAADKIAQFGGQDSKANGNKPVTRIRIGDFSVGNHYDKEKKVTYWNVAVFDFEPQDGASSSAPQKKDTSFMNIPDSDSTELPFN